MSNNESLQVVESSHLLDADWSEINKIQRAYKEGGKTAADKALEELAKSQPIRFFNVIEAFWPRMALEATRDALARAGLTEDDLVEMKRRFESPAREQ